MKQSIQASIRPETLSEVDADTRDRFTVDTAERTIERVQTMQDALSRDERGNALRDALKDEGVEAGLAAGIPRAIDHYGTTQTYLDAVRGMALDAARVVAGEREEVSPLGVAPDEGGAAGHGVALDSNETDAEAEPAAEVESTDGSAVASGHGTGGSVETESTTDTDESATTEATTESAATGDEDAVDDPLEATDEPASEGAESDASDGEPGGTADTATEANLDPEEFELDDDERERIEDQYGTDFESAAEVDGPGEADIETPTPEETSVESDDEPALSGGADTEVAATTETEPTDDTETTGLADDASDTPDADTEPDEGDESTDGSDMNIDPEQAVVAAMRDLDDGDGAEREAVIDRVVEDHGFTRADAADGIQSALMSGECYEADDDTFKPI